jgi:hypothetical protein
MLLAVAVAAPPLHVTFTVTFFASPAVLPPLLPSHEISQYSSAFGTPTAKDLALRTFRAMDDAWHTPTYGGYLETAANGFPQDLPPPNITAAGAVADEESVIDALAGNSTYLFSSGEVVTANSSTPPDAAGSAGLTAAGNEPRSLTTLLHGVEALAALHKVTNGASSHHGVPESHVSDSMPCLLYRLLLASSLLPIARLSH